MPSEFAGKFVRMDEAIEAIRKVAPGSPMPDDIPEEVEMIWSYLSGAMEEVKLLPTFEYPLVSDGWIPVSERLPEEGKTVLISYGVTKPTVDSAQRWESSFLQPGYDPYYFKDVTAWQPLPNPPTSHR